VPDWDADGPQLRKNLAEVLEEIARASRRRDVPTLETARHWQIHFLKKLKVPDSRFMGAFRGESGLENVQVKIGGRYGVPAAEVADAVANFERKLQALVVELDSWLPVGEDPDADRLSAILDICAWVHSEWVRIHPFANGNGRTARLWANYRHALWIAAFYPFASEA